MGDEVHVLPEDIFKTMVLARQNSFKILFQVEESCEASAYSFSARLDNGPGGSDSPSPSSASDYTHCRSGASKAQDVDLEGTEGAVHLHMWFDP